MVHLTSIELEGFKSFRTRVTVPVHTAFTCILGANGSGKSNLIEAICFVLGMPVSTLRVTAISAVVSTGCDCARVTLRFDDGTTVVERTVTKGKSAFRWGGRKTSPAEHAALLLERLGIDVSFPARITVMQHNVAQLAATGAADLLSHIDTVCENGSPHAVRGRCGDVWGDASGDNAPESVYAWYDAAPD